MIKKPANGFAVRFMTQFACELENSRRADGGHADPAAAAFDLGMAVLVDSSRHEGSLIRDEVKTAVFDNRLCFEVDQLLNELGRGGSCRGLLGLRWDGGGGGSGRRRRREAFSGAAAAVSSVPVVFLFEFRLL